jgi:hypothetical protein
MGAIAMARPATTALTRRDDMTTLLVKVSKVLIVQRFGTLQHYLPAGVE